MNNLTTPDFTHYRNGEFLQFMKNTLQVYHQTDLTSLLLNDKFQSLQEQTQAMDDVFQPQLAQELTPELFQLDTRRDKALMGIKIYLESQTYREEPTRVIAAQNLYANYVSHGERIDKLSYQQETAIVEALLQDWSNGTLLSGVETLELGSWVDLLAHLNKDFNSKYVKRAEETPQPAEIDLKRIGMKEAYENLTNDTEAYARVASNKTPYLSLIKSLNGLIDDYNLAVTQRLSGKGTDSEILEGDNSVQ